MSDDPHPAIKRQNQYDGGSGSDIDPENFAITQQLKFVMYDPGQRAATFEELDRIIGSNEGSLRQRSQLLRVRQRLAFTDRAMRKASR